MKKILIFICCLLLIGCSNFSSEEKIYNNYISELKNINYTSKNIPFDINVNYYKLNDKKIRYEITIDNTKKDIYSIEAIGIHNRKTNDIFPSIGIFDNKEKLLVNKKPKGILLVGYIDYNKDFNKFKCTMKVLVKYKTSDNKLHKVYYVTKK